MTWEVIHGDCLAVLATMPNLSADVCITDSPYSEETHKGARGLTKGATDANGKRGYAAPEKLVDFNHISLSDLRLRFDEIGRVTKRWTVATMDYKHIVELEREPPKFMRFVRFGIWRKADGSPQFTGDRPGMGWEGVAHLHREGTKMRWHGGGRHGWYKAEHDPCNDYMHNTDKSGDYPTLKPLSLIQEFIRLFTDPDDLIIDPFCGSGRVGEACILEGRRFIGMDISREACDLATANLTRASGVPCDLPKRAIKHDRPTPLFDVPSHTEATATRETLV